MLLPACPTSIPSPHFLRLDLERRVGGDTDHLADDDLLLVPDIAGPVHVGLDALPRLLNRVEAVQQARAVEVLDLVDVGGALGALVRLSFGVDDALAPDCVCELVITVLQ